MSEAQDRPAYSFGGEPPPEVTAFFRGKADRISFAFRDVEPEEHALAFTVAKAMQLDVLQTIREEVDRALAEGTTMADFQRNLRPRLEAAGWWGRAQAIDPATGQPVEVQLGSARRLRTIYRANMRAARSAGQWTRIERASRALPFLIYLLGPSERHRPHHADKNGWVLPVDDPFWDAWMPPNGWGCKCHVRQITRREAESRGITETPRIPTVEVRNPRTGEVRRVPQGLDPAWSANPGKVRLRNAEAFLAGRIEAAEPELAAAAIADLVASFRFRRLVEAPLERAAAEVVKSVGAVPVAVMSEAQAEALGASTRVVKLSEATAEKLARKGRERGVLRPEDYVIVQRALNEGEIWLDRKGHFIVLLTDGGALWRLAVKATVAGDEVLMTTLHRIQPEQAAAIRSAEGSRRIR